MSKKMQHLIMEQGVEMLKRVTVAKLGAGAKQMVGVQEVEAVVKQVAAAAMQVEDVDFKELKYAQNNPINTIIVRLSSNQYQSMSTITSQTWIQNLKLSKPK